MNRATRTVIVARAAAVFGLGLLLGFLIGRSERREDLATPSSSVTAPGQQTVSSTPVTLGECGEVPVAGDRVVWVVEQATTATGAPAFAARILTYVPDEGGGSSGSAPPIPRASAGRT